MRIKELHIQNFRGFEDITIQFPESNVCVFIGANGSGKSTLLEAIDIFFEKANCDFSNGLPPYAFKLFIEKLLDEDINIDSKDVKNLIKFSLNKKIFEMGSSKVKGEEKSLTDWTESSNEILKELSKPPILVSFRANRNLRYVNIRQPKTQPTNQEVTYYLAYRETLDFQGFFEWFRLEEDKENEYKIRNRNLDFVSSALQNIRNAISLFFSELGGIKFSDLRADREDNDFQNGFQGNFNSFLSILRGVTRFKLHQLSDGEKGLLMIVCDIARRIAIIDSENKIDKCQGIILIDEIELHLHPQWQRNVIPALRKTFPNIQFIITTHSPQVLSNIDKSEIRILKDWQVFLPSIETLGNDTNSILPLMDTSIRPVEVDIELDEIFKLINDKKFEEAQKRGEKLVKNKKISPNDTVFRRIDSLKTRMSILGK